MEEETFNQLWGDGRTLLSPRPGGVGVASRAGQEVLFTQQGLHSSESGFSIFRPWSKIATMTIDVPNKMSWLDPMRAIGDPLVSKHTGYQTVIWAGVNMFDRDVVTLRRAEDTHPIFWGASSPLYGLFHDIEYKYASDWKVLADPQFVRCRLWENCRKTYLERRFAWALHPSDEKLFWR